MGATTTYQFPKFSNKEKLPVVVVGGCHNALFKFLLFRFFCMKKKLKTSIGLIIPHLCVSAGDYASFLGVELLLQRDVQARVRSRCWNEWSVGDRLLYEIGQQGVETLGLLIVVRYRSIYKSIRLDKMTRISLLNGNYSVIQVSNLADFHNNIFFFLLIRIQNIRFFGYIKKIKCSKF